MHKYFTSSNFTFCQRPANEPPSPPPSPPACLPTTPADCRPPKPPTFTLINKYIHSNTNLPIYLISGDQDPVGINGKGVVSLHEFLLQRFNKTEINLVGGSRHEVFNEINKEESFDDLIKFIDSNI